MKNNITRKEKITNNLINSTNSYSYLIIKMLNKETLDNLINKITDTKTKTKITTLTKKKYLSGEEQFIYLLNNFICLFKEDFYFLQKNSDYIIEILLQNEKYTKYLLCKKDIGNNKNIPFFSYNTKKLITSGFYYNIKKLAKKSEIIKKYAKDHNINLRKNIIDNNNGVDILYHHLLNLAICNAKELNNILLFENINYYTEQTIKNSKTNHNNIKKSIQKYYITQWEIMITNHRRKQTALDLLLK